MRERLPAHLEDSRGLWEVGACLESQEQEARWVRGSRDGVAVGSEL